LQVNRSAKDQGHAQRLQDQAKFWPAPNANPAPRGVNFTNSGSHYKPHDLMTAVNQWPAPAAGLCEIACQSSVLVPAKPKSGLLSSPAGRKLNPLFVESLMGLPLGWTASEPLGTASFRWWLRTHTEAFARLSKNKFKPLSA